MSLVLFPPEPLSIVDPDPCVCHVPPGLEPKGYRLHSPQTWNQSNRTPQPVKGGMTGVCRSDMTASKILPENILSTPVPSTTLERRPYPNPDVHDISTLKAGERQPGRKLGNQQARPNGSRLGKGTGRANHGERGQSASGQPGTVHDQTQTDAVRPREESPKEGKGARGSLPE